MSSPGAGMSLNWGSRSENGGSAASPGKGADAEHVRQGRRRAHRARAARATGRSSHRCDDEHALRDHVGNRVRLELRVRCHGSDCRRSRGPLRLMSSPVRPSRPTTGSPSPRPRRESSPESRRPSPIRSSAGGAARPCRCRRSSWRRSAGDEGAMALDVDRRRSLDEAPRRHDAATQLRMSAVDARVDHGDADRGERRRLGPGVERPVLGGVPLLRQEWVVRDVRLAPAAERFT